MTTKQEKKSNRNETETETLSPKEGYEVVDKNLKDREAYIKASMESLALVGVQPTDEQVEAIRSKALEIHPVKMGYKKIAMASISEARNQAMNSLYRLARLKAEGHTIDLEPIAGAIQPLIGDRVLEYKENLTKTGEVQYYKGKPVMRWLPTEAPLTEPVQILEAIRDRIRKE